MNETFSAGPYTIRVCIRADNPAFPLFRIFRGQKFIGKQFSRPCESDCAWLERENGVYATESKPLLPEGPGARRSALQRYNGLSPCRRGRPTKAEQAKRAASVLEVPEPEPA